MIFLRAAILAFFFVFVALAQKSELENAFASYQLAWTNADKTALANLVSEDLVWITRGGRALNKQELLQVFNPTSGTKNIREQKVRILGGVAVMTYAGDEGSNSIRRTIVWSNSPQGWKIISVQATAIQK